MSKTVHTREMGGAADRLRRLLASRGSAWRAAGDLAEEAYVRAMVKAPVRRAANLLMPRHAPQRWLFIVGCYNSGTTILKRILGHHPDVASLPREGVRFTARLSDLQNDGHHMFWGEGWERRAVPEGDGAATAAAVLADWNPLWRGGRGLYLEKSISHTARIGFLNRHFPNARFVGLHRNGYCVAEGLHRRSRPPQWLKDRLGLPHYPVEMTGRQWLNANQAMLDGLAGVENKMMVSFEEFVTRPDAVVARICDFAGLEPGPLSFRDGRLSAFGASFEIRNPNPGSLARLSEADRQVLSPLIDDMMQRLGYGASP